MIQVNKNKVNKRSNNSSIESYTLTSNDNSKETTKLLNMKKVFNISQNELNTLNNNIYINDECINGFTTVINQNFDHSNGKVMTRFFYPDLVNRGWEKAIRYFKPYEKTKNNFKK